MKARVLCFYFLSMFFSSSFLYSATFVQSGNQYNIADLSYASKEKNEKTQILPIPAKINDIIFPTGGFPSLISRNDAFSIVLQLSETARKELSTYKDFKIEVLISPHFKPPQNYKIPDGFESEYGGNYQDFYYHRTRAHPEFFRTTKAFKNREEISFSLNIMERLINENYLIVRVSIPALLPEYLNRALDMRVIIKLQDKIIIDDIQSHCLGLISEKKNKFKFIHFSDPQINDTEFSYQGKVDFLQRDLFTQEFALEQAASEMNFLKPDFAVVSGDIVAGSHPLYGMMEFNALRAFVPPDERGLELQSYWNEYVSMFQFFRLLNFPVFLAHGNHDGFVAFEERNHSHLDDKEAHTILYDGKHYFNKIFGPRYYSFDYGRWHFVVLDTYDLKQKYRAGYSWIVPNHGGGISKEQILWLEADLKAARTSDKFIVLVGHHDPRAGAKGMFYDQSNYRREQRKSLPLDQELKYQYFQFKKDPLFAAQQWTKPAPEDGEYDSSQELLKLMETYGVSYFLLGHDHADYEDEVMLGKTRVRFIHTTSLCATTYEARDKSSYIHKSGEGSSYSPQWGYRMFEANEDGHLNELITTIHDDATYPSLTLGNIRFKIGYDDEYRSFSGGILKRFIDKKNKRPIPAWLPLSQFIQKLHTNEAISDLYLHRDPILSYFALIHPDVSDLSQKMMSENELYSYDMYLLKKQTKKIYKDIKEMVGTKQLPKLGMIKNLHQNTIEGILELWIDAALSRDTSYDISRIGSQSLLKIPLTLLPMTEDEQYVLLKFQ